MVRRGATGSSAELYTPEQLARVDALALASLARRGSAFPYAARFMQGQEAVGIEQPAIHRLPTILEWFRGQVSMKTPPKNTRKTRYRTFL
jgi:hypothetical protein